ncbi:hypothetical protein OIU77_002530 [Salix suchowensis]|uniref:Uncharacterized protein n=1 Tax=Salix suchowensis TaxID=1278906 RepID=A0ABQ9AXR0_9ROSI|nr:hypothetical protein OIU77_002530 [Salix suchowensis]
MPSAPVKAKVVLAAEKVLVKRWVPIKERVDPMLLETDVGEWTVVKKRNGKSRVANDNVVSVTSLGDPVCSVGIDVDPLCGVTT